MQAIVREPPIALGDAGKGRIADPFPWLQGDGATIPFRFRYYCNLNNDLKIYE
jgi:hypothetical protein